MLTEVSGTLIMGVLCLYEISCRGGHFGCSVSGRPLRKATQFHYARALICRNEI